MYNGECSILIKDIKPGLKNINVIFIVLEIGTATVTKENREVRNFKVGDHSACINVSIWDEPGKLIAPGDIIKLTKGYASIWRHCLTLYSGKNGEVFKIGEFCMTFNEQINMSEPKRPEQQQQPPQGLGSIVGNPQLMSNTSGGTSGTVMTANTNGPVAPLTQVQQAGSNGSLGSNVTGAPRVITTALGGGVQPTGVTTTVKTGSITQAGQTIANNPMQPTAQVVTTTTAIAPSTHASKANRGGRTGATRSSNLKNERK